MPDWPPARRANIMFAVYAIKSLSSNRIYIGQTNDVWRRLDEHNRGIVRSTKMVKPWEIVAIQMVKNRSEARWIEKRLKRSKGMREKWMSQYAYGSES